MLSTQPDPLPSCYTLYKYITCTYSHRQGEGGEVNQWEGRGALVHKRGRKYQYDCRYLHSPVYKLHWTPVKTTFRVRGLSSYLVHGHTFPTRLCTFKSISFILWLLFSSTSPAISCPVPIYPVQWNKNSTGARKILISYNQNVKLHLFFKSWSKKV